jgi:hypothetical protein
MTSTTLTAPFRSVPPRKSQSPTEIPSTWADNRVAYVGFAAAYLLGHGGTALTVGPNPVIDAPSWIPMILLGIGLAVGTIAATVASTRLQRGLSAHQALPGKLLGMAWITGFAGLFLLITGLSATMGDAGLQALLWPTGSGLVVGLIYVAEGAMRRDTLHYTLGSVLIVVATSVLFLPTASAIGILAVAGGAAYITATIIDQRRRTRR